MSSFVIKIIAIITMLIDHSCDVIIKHYSMGYVIGRIAFPLFAFQLVIGYKNTHDIKEYLKRLLIFALISQAPYGLMFYNYVHRLDINIFFTLFFALISLIILHSKEIRIHNKKIDLKNNYLTWILKILLIAIICILCEVLNFDHGYGGILTVLCIDSFYPYNLKKDEFARSKSQMKKEKKALRILLFIIIMTALSIIRFARYIQALGITNFVLLIASTFISTIIMICYNGKKGKSFQYFFYSFYPIHLTILDVIYYVI